MIGDWIQNTNGNKGKVIGFRYYPDLKENDIVISYNGNDTTWSSPSLIEPIRITDEILNLNFTSPPPDIWKLGPDSENYIFNDDGKYLLSICDEDYNYFIDHFHFHYVHELQNMLRLCGLNDIADNFKIY